MGEVQRKIVGEVLSWPGVTSAPHRFGGVEFRFKDREIGHLHGDHLADLPFPLRVRDELVAAGRARPHHILPRSGWVSCPIHGESDVPQVIELFRMQYQRLVGRVETGEAESGGR